MGVKSAVLKHIGAQWGILFYDAAAGRPIRTIARMHAASVCECVLPCHGPTSQGITDQRNEYKLSDKVQPGQTYTIYMEMACNGMFGTTDGGNSDGIVIPSLFLGVVER